MDTAQLFNWKQINILSDDADKVFGIRNPYYSLDDTIVELALRYIAITHRGDTPVDELLIPRARLYDDRYLSDIDAEYLKGMLANYKGNGNIYVLRSSIADSGIDDINEYVASHWGQEWESLNTKEFPLDDFLSKIDSTGNYETKCFINNNTEDVVIIAKTISTKWKRCFASALFRLLRRYYPTVEAAQCDKEFFSAISMLGSSRKVRHPDTNEQIQADALAKIILKNLVESACGEINFSDYAITSMLKGYSTAAITYQISDLKSQYDRVASDIASYETNLAEKYARKTMLCENLEILENNSKNPDKDKEIINFFKAHSELCVKNVEDVVRGKRIFYLIRTTLEYFDEDEFERIYNNPNSYMNEHYCEYDFSRPLLKAALIDGRAQIRVQSEFLLTNLSGIEVAYHDSSFEHQGYIPHPHLTGFRCLGANSQYIRKYLDQGDWDMAIEQTIGATKNINFGDSTVVKHFMSSLYQKKNSVKCFVTPDGQELTPLQFSEYIKKEEEKEVATNE